MKQVEMWAITYPNRPTFYLDPHVCGIVDRNHAIHIASEVLGLCVTIPGGFDSRIEANKVDIDRKESE